MAVVHREFEIVAAGTWNNTAFTPNEYFAMNLVYSALTSSTFYVTVP